MRETESEGGARGEGRGGNDDEDGGGGQNKTEAAKPQVFSFGYSSGESSKKKVRQDGEAQVKVKRNPISISYKEKLLAVSGAGYLMQHDEEEDIVNGWKAFFAKGNEGTEGGNDVCCNEEDEEVLEKYPKLNVTQDQYSAWCKPWMNSLIFKVLGKSVPKHVLIDRVRRMWKPQQPMKVLPLSNDFFIASFSNREDRDYAFQEGPWMIDDHYLLVQKWRPNFNPARADNQRKIAAWVRIPDLPVELYSVESLGMIGNMIGRIIKIDRSTSLYDKGGFARICVEIDLGKPLIPAFIAFGEIKQLVYEGLHQVCFHCGIYGHEQQNCPQHYAGVNQSEKKDKEEKDNDCGKQKENVEIKQQAVTVKDMSEVMTGTLPPVEDACLGPKMIHSRDVRNNIKYAFMKENHGIQKQDLSSKAKKGMENYVGSQSGNGKKDLARNVEKLVTNSRNFGNDVSNSQQEWVVVGSKRKKNEKPKVFRKENVGPVRPKFRKNNQDQPHLGQAVISTNSFEAVSSLVNNENYMDLETNVPSTGAIDHMEETSSVALKAMEEDKVKLYSGVEIANEGTESPIDSMGIPSQDNDLLLGGGHALQGPLVSQ